MPLAAVSMFLMPCLMMGLCIVAGARLESHPGKDDLWKLPRPSSLR